MFCIDYSSFCLHLDCLVLELFMWSEKPGVVLHSFRICMQIGVRTLRHEYSSSTCFNGRKNEDFVITTLCNFQCCMSYKGLQNCANFAEIRF
ncbi:hypothetical protein BpHYR1_052314 [Brachionus plicatilis]|uniref:Uncharacterized protein n=1 Tax=Brachionus plicatilis TaxID=10195 RepID=A0A3M7T3K9_BRAPC|nr:hypothetical protein BpHYR1_052314 [Brachionus plicatilis]